MNANIVRIYRIHVPESRVILKVICQLNQEKLSLNIFEQIFELFETC